MGEEEGEEGEFVGARTDSSSQRTPMLESLPDGEDVDRDEVSPVVMDDSNANVAVEEPSESSTTRTTSRERTSVRRAGGFTLRDLEEEREIVQRRTGACILLSSFILLRLWIQAVMTGDFGLLL